MFHKEGHKIILIALLLSIFIVIGAEYLISINWLKIILQLTVLVLLVLILQFFRNPKRNTKIDDAKIIAPVDGKVVVIEEVFEKEYFKDVTA